MLSAAARHALPLTVRLALCALHAARTQADGHMRDRRA